MAVASGLVALRMSAEATLAAAEDEHMPAEVIQYIRDRLADVITAQKVVVAALRSAISLGAPKPGDVN